MYNYISYLFLIYLNVLKCKYILSFTFYIKILYTKATISHNRAQIRYLTRQHNEVAYLLDQSYNNACWGSLTRIWNRAHNPRFFRSSPYSYFSSLVKHPASIGKQMNGEESLPHRLKMRTADESMAVKQERAT